LILLELELVTNRLASEQFEDSLNRLLVVLRDARNVGREEKGNQPAVVSDNAKTSISS
jgi:hypothetical protein